MDVSDRVREVAKQYLERSKKTGPDNLMALCPFHRKADGTPENNPSFAISLTSGLWICHSCKEAGNLKSFLRKVGVSGFIIDTIHEDLIQELEKQRPKKQDPLNPKLVTQDPLPSSLLGVFDMVPTDLEREGFTEETLQYFDVGFDKDHMRITFPLRDFKGNLVGISGRTVLDVHPRYKVYDREFVRWGLPARTLDKRSILWNAHRVCPAVFTQPDAFIVVVEGFKACMWLHQAGIRNVVGLLGSYMSEEQRWMLQRMGAEVLLMLDNDRAGQIGRAAIGKVLAKSLKTRIVEYDSSIPQPSDLSVEQIVDSLSRSTEYYRWSINRRL